MTNLTNGVEMEAPIERRHHDGDVKKTRSKTGGESDKSKRGSKHSDRSPRKSKKSTSSKKSSFPLEEKTSYSVTFSPSSEPSSSPLLPLVDAVIKGNAADLADIVKSGQDVEAAGTSGMKDYEGVKAAPLFWAALLNQPVCVDALLKLGASLASTCIVLSPPSADSTRSFSKLLDFGGLTPLHGAIYRNNSDVAGMLIDAGADIKAVGGSEENNCVQFAAEKKAAETLRVIIEKSRDVATLVNAKNKMGETALHLGSVHKEKDTIEAILGVEGVQIEAINDVEQTPLHIAARSGSLDCVRLLLEKGASVNAKDIKGNTPLHLAAIGGYEAMVSLLIKKGAKVTEENLDNKTAMHLATEHGKDDVCYILTTNGADVSIRYQWGDSHRKVHSFEEDELIGMAKSANTFGFLEEDKRSKQTIAVKLDEEKVKKRERKRAQRWAPMVIEWDRWERKKYPQLSRRVYKGLPDSLRCECWKLLTHCKQYKIENPSINYHDLILQDSKWADQIDLDVNRSFRNHILFKERFGSGQVSLFNILKAYANYDKEVGYCQGMSDMTALLLMYVSEEDAFWILTRLLRDPKYDLQGRFLPGFPLLQRSFWVFEKLLLKSAPKVAKHFEKEGVMTTFYATKWFLLVFLDAFPFNITVRIWDIYFLEGYDVVYTIALAFMKIHEKKILSLPFDQILGFFRSFETAEVDADEFITETMKYQVKSKKIRRLEAKYDAEQKGSTKTGRTKDKKDR